MVNIEKWLKHRSNIIAEIYTLGLFAVFLFAWTFMPCHVFPVFPFCFCNFVMISTSCHFPTVGRSSRVGNLLQQIILEVKDH